MVENCLIEESPNFIKEKLLGTFHIDYKGNLRRIKIKEVKSNPLAFEDGEYEMELFRPGMVGDGSDSDSILNREDLLGQYKSEEWYLGTIHHLIILVEVHRISTMKEVGGLPIVAAGSWDKKSRCPTICTDFYKNGKFLLKLSSNWPIKKMPYFLIVRKINKIGFK